MGPADRMIYKSVVTSNWGSLRTRALHTTFHTVKLVEARVYNSSKTEGVCLLKMYCPRAFLDFHSTVSLRNIFIHVKCVHAIR
jgi:hypothetical protein